MTILDNLLSMNFEESDKDRRMTRIDIENISENELVNKIQEAHNNGLYAAVTLPDYTLIQITDDKEALDVAKSINKSFHDSFLYHLSAGLKRLKNGEIKYNNGNGYHYISTVDIDNNNLRKILKKKPNKLCLPILVGFFGWSKKDDNGVILFLFVFDSRRKMRKAAKVINDFKDKFIQQHGVGTFTL